MREKERGGKEKERESERERERERERDLTEEWRKDRQRAHNKMDERLFFLVKDERKILELFAFFLRRREMSRQKFHSENVGNS